MYMNCCAIVNHGSACIHTNDDDRDEIYVYIAYTYTQSHNLSNRHGGQHTSARFRDHN